MKYIVILLGVLTFSNTAMAAFSFGGSAGDDSRYTNPYNNRQTGEGNAIDLSCACAQRILNKQEKADMRCYNFVQGFDRAIMTPNSATPFQVPTTAHQGA